MTQKEIDKFLANTKVYVNGKSKEIQEKLFSLGYSWCDGIKSVFYVDKPFLYIEDNKKISYGTDMQFFISKELSEISAEEILSIELTEPAYSPFKTQEECWNEMLKHQPFGFIKNTSTQEYNNIVIVYTEEDNPYVAICNLNGIVSFHTDYMFLQYTFADGTQFGIKEE